MLKKYGDQRFIGASLGSAKAAYRRNDRAFASSSIEGKALRCRQVPYYEDRGLAAD